MRKTKSCACLSLGLWLTACGCGPSAFTRESSNTTTVELQSAAAGPVRVKVFANSAEPRAGETLTISVVADTDVRTTLQFPDYAASLTQAENHFGYRVLGSRAPAPARTPDGKVRWIREYDVEFILSGDHELPPVSMTYTAHEGASSPEENATPRVVVPDAGHAEASPDEAQGELATEPIKLTIRDSGSSALSPEELRNIPELAPVEIPQPWKTVRAIALSLLGAGVVSFALLYWLRRRRIEAARELILPAHEWARREIARLLAENLIARDRRQEYFYRLSDIVRGYIERRFAVAAPEMTTEEFFRWMSADRRFDPKDRDELSEFMSACDIVKYARHEPTTDEARVVLDRAIDYIERTRERMHAAATEQQTRERAA